MGNELIGQSLGRYHILEQLGEGGMAIVYKAFDTRLERSVAIKVILPGKEHSEKFLKRFEREAKALASLSHPNILKVIDFGEHEGLPYLVMEYIPGGTLKQKLVGKSMPWQDAVRLLIPIARALAHAHTNKIIHRDVKPANILITQSGEPMLSDFGIAKMLEAEETLDLTGTGVGVGTPEYMSPEQAQGKQVDARSDVYSIGVVLYEMVTGRKPYQADTPMAVVWKLASESMPRPRQFAPNLPQTVENILLKALVKSPDNRYQNMSEFVAALERLVSGKSSKEDLADNKQELSRLGNRGLVYWIIAGVVGISLIGIFVGWFSNRGVAEVNPTNPPSFTSTPQDIIQVTAKINTPLATRTPYSTATNVPVGTVLFEDDFEKGSGQWSIDSGWELRSNSDGNQYYCVRTQTSEYSYARAGSSNWRNYSFHVKVMIVQSSVNGSLNITTRVKNGYSYSDYVLDLSERWSGLAKEAGPPFNMTVISSTGSILSSGIWQDIRFEASGSHLEIYLNDELLLQGNESTLDHGAISLGAGGQGMDICFDNVKVTALGE